MEDLVKEEETIKVIAIKLPFDLQERFLTFPFLHALRERYPKADIHFITPKKQIEILNLLPFTAYYHEFDENEIRTVFDVHRYCAYAKIYNVDLFVSLTNTFPDAALGLGLRARQRLGFSDGWKSVVLNEKVPRPVGHHICEDFFELYKAHVGANVDTKLRVMSRDVPFVIPDYDSAPYIAINLAPMRTAAIDEEWKELIQRFENQRFIFFASEDQPRASAALEALKGQFPKTISYSFYTHKDWIELGKFLAYSKGVITMSGPCASLAAYVGTKTLILYDREDPKRTAPFYFLSDFNVMSANDPSVVQSSAAKGVLKDRVKFSADAVFQRAIEFFKL